jgi:hypothetical protein
MSTSMTLTCASGTARCAHTTGQWKTTSVISVLNELLEQRSARSENRWRDTRSRA